MYASISVSYRKIGQGQETAGQAVNLFSQRTILDVQKLLLQYYIHSVANFHEISQEEKAILWKIIAELEYFACCRSSATPAATHTAHLHQKDVSISEVLLPASQAGVFMQSLQQPGMRLLFFPSVRPRNGSCAMQRVKHFTFLSIWCQLHFNG